MESNETKTINQMKLKLSIILIILAITISCVKNDSPNTIGLSKNWKFSPDEKNIGMSDKWYAIDFDDSQGGIQLMLEKIGKCRGIQI